MSDDCPFDTIDTDPTKEDRAPSWEPSSPAGRNGAPLDAASPSPTAEQEQEQEPSNGVSTADMPAHSTSSTQPPPSPDRMSMSASEASPTAAAHTQPPAGPPPKKFPTPRAAAPKKMLGHNPFGAGDSSEDPFGTGAAEHAQDNTQPAPPPPALVQFPAKTMTRPSATASRSSSAISSTLPFAASSTIASPTAPTAPTAPKLAAPQMPTLAAAATTAAPPAPVTAKKVVPAKVRVAAFNPFAASGGPADNPFGSPSAVEPSPFGFSAAPQPEAAKTAPFTAPAQAPAFAPAPPAAVEDDFVPDDSIRVDEAPPPHPSLGPFASIAPLPLSQSAHGSERRPSSLHFSDGSFSLSESAQPSVPTSGRALKSQSPPGAAHQPTLHQPAAAQRSSFMGSSQGFGGGAEVSPFDDFSAPPEPTPPTHPTHSHQAAHVAHTEGTTGYPHASTAQAHHPHPHMPFQPQQGPTATHLSYAQAAPHAHTAPYHPTASHPAFEGQPSQGHWQPPSPHAAIPQSQQYAHQQHQHSQNQNQHPQQHFIPSAAPSAAPSGAPAAPAPNPTTSTLPATQHSYFMGPQTHQRSAAPVAPHAHPGSQNTPPALSEAANVPHHGRQDSFSTQDPPHASRGSSSAASPNPAGTARVPGKTSYVPQGRSSYQPRSTSATAAVLQQQHQQAAAQRGASAVMAGPLRSVSATTAAEATVAGGGAALFNIDRMLTRQRCAPLVAFAPGGLLCAIPVHHSPQAPPGGMTLSTLCTAPLAAVLAVPPPSMTLDSSHGGQASLHGGAAAPATPAAPLGTHFSISSTRVGRAYAQMLSSAMPGACTDIGSMGGDVLAEALRKVASVAEDADGVRSAPGAGSPTSAGGPSSVPERPSRSRCLFELLARVCENANKPFDWHYVAPDAGTGGGPDSAAHAVGAADIVALLGDEVERSKALDAMRLRRLGEAPDADAAAKYNAVNAEHRANTALWSGRAGRNANAPPAVSIHHALAELPNPHLPAAPVPWGGDECAPMVQQFLAVGDRHEALQCALHYADYTVALLIAITMDQETYTATLKHIVGETLSPHTPLYHALLLHNDVVAPLGRFPARQPEASSPGAPFGAGGGGDDPETYAPFSTPDEASSTTARAWASHVQMIVAGSARLAPEALVQWGDFLLQQLERAFPQASTISTQPADAGDDDDALGGSSRGGKLLAGFSFSEIVEAAHFCFVVAQLNPMTRALPAVVEQLKSKYLILGGLHQRHRCRAALLRPQNVLLTEALEFARQKDQLLMVQAAATADGQTPNAAQMPPKYVRPQLLPFRVAMGMLYAEMGMPTQAVRYLDHVLNILPVAPQQPSARGGPAAQNPPPMAPPLLTLNEVAQCCRQWLAAAQLPQLTQHKSATGAVGGAGDQKSSSKSRWGLVWPFSSQPTAADSTTTAQPSATQTTATPLPATTKMAAVPPPTQPPSQSHVPPPPTAHHHAHQHHVDPLAATTGSMPNHPHGGAAESKTSSFAGPATARPAEKAKDTNSSSTGAASASGPGLFGRLFGRGKKEKEEEKEKPKPMHLDSEAPQFDPVTGKWKFPESEEEKAIKAMIAAGPPPAPGGMKKAPSPGPGHDPQQTGGVPPPSQPFVPPQQSPGHGYPPHNPPVFMPNPGGPPPAPGAPGPAAVAGGAGGPKMMMMPGGAVPTGLPMMGPPPGGQGQQRRLPQVPPQYVDMFNS